MSDPNIYKDLTLLGGETNLPNNPDEAILERVPNPQKDVNYCVRFTAPEFTSLCPLTGQPDFAHLVIDYVPKDWLVESKSLKLYIFSFRQVGTFYEEIVNRIYDDLYETLNPRTLIVEAKFTPRGGITSTVKVDSREI